MAYNQILKFALLALLVGCNDPSSGMTNGERSAWNSLREKVTEAMCAPWGAERETILADLLEASQNPAFGEMPTSDHIRDIASEVEEEDCEALGYSGNGPKPVDIERVLRRCARGEVPPPPWFDEEQRAQSLERSAARQDRCAELGRSNTDNRN